MWDSVRYISILQAVSKNFACLCTLYCQPSLYMISMTMLTCHNLLSLAFRDLCDGRDNYKEDYKCHVLGVYSQMHAQTPMRLAKCNCSSATIHGCGVYFNDYEINETAKQITVCCEDGFVPVY